MKKTKCLRFLVVLTVFAINMSFASADGFSSFLKTMNTVVNSVEAVKDTTQSFAKAFEQITPENEYYIGRSVAATLLTSYRTYSNPVLEQYLNKICQSLVTNSNIPEIYNGYHVKMLDTDEVNAFATSGGHIFVTRGLLECTTNEDSLAAVIAHEIGHIQLKHGLKAIKTSRFADAGLQTVKAVSKVSEVGNAQALDGMVGDVVTQMVNNGYSQTQEFDADSFAVDLLKETGFAPDEIITMLELIDSKQEGKKTGFYKTHPSPKTRISKIKARLGNSNATANESRTNRYAKVMEQYKVE